MIVRMISFRKRTDMEQQRNYRVLALDLDGTLTNAKKEITPRTKAAIHRAIASGVHVVLASGRPLLGVWPVACDLELDRLGGYILAYNGGLILKCDTNEAVFRRLLPGDAVHRICDWADGRPLCPLAYDSQGIVTPCPDDPYVQKEAYNNALTIRHVPDLPGYVNYPIEKMMLVGAPEDAAQAIPVLRNRFGGLLNIFGSEPHFIEVMPPEVDKAFSLGILLKHLNVDRDALIACGDGMNDLPMLQYAGLSVAMENAAPVVKAEARFVTLSNENDGVAYVIEKFLHV